MNNVQRFLQAVLMWPLFLVGILPLSSAPASAIPEPDIKSEGANLQFNGHAFFQFEDHTSLLEYINQGHSEGSTFQQAGIGYRYRVLENLKIGAGYLRQYGNRHDDDWVKTSIWHWRRTSARGENLVRLELIPKFWLGPFIFEWRQKYQYNFHNQHRHWFTRPGLVAPFDFGPRLNGQAILAYEMVIPLHGDSRRMSEEWTYLTILLKVLPRLQAGLQAAYGEQYWSSTARFYEITRKVYRMRHTSWMVGPVVNWYVDL